MKSPLFGWCCSLLPAAACLALACVAANAQSIGPNIDVVQEPVACSLPGCDKFNKMLETDVAVSPLNPARAVVAFNDYRYSLVSGQSWCTYAFTKDGGYLWKNFAVPDLPGTPAQSSGNFCTDPAAVWDVFGNAHIVFLAGTSGNDTQVFAVTLPDKTDASGDLDPAGANAPVQIDLGQNFTGTGLDKPSIAYSAPNALAPNGILHVAYAIFDGSASRTKVMYARSLDRGATFSKPVKLNNTLKQNNNTAIVVGADGTIYIFWTTFDPTQSGIVFVKSTDGGQSFTTPSYIAGVPNSFFPYNQVAFPASTNFFSDRTLVVPTAVAAGPTGSSPDRLLVAWQEYVNTATGAPASPVDANGNVVAGVSPRIVVTASFDQGRTWSPRAAAQTGPSDAMQVKPRLAFSGGLASLLFEDARGGGCAYSVPAGTGFNLPLMNGLTCKRNILVMQADLSNWTSGLPGWLSPLVVTQFPKKNGQIVNRQPNCVGGNCPAVYEPNHPSSSGGTIAFTGDYIGHAPDHPLVRDAATGNWRLPLLATDPRTFYAAWDDNRWEKLPLNSSGVPEENGTLWGPYDPNKCLNPGTRNTKPFVAKISPGLAAYWTGTDKQLQLPNGTTVVQFVLTVQNLTAQDRLVQVTIPSTSGWSFSSTTLLTAFTTRIDRYSSISKILVRAASGSPSIQVTAQTADGLQPPLAANLTFAVNPTVLSINSLNGAAVSGLKVKCLNSTQCNQTASGTFNTQTQPSFGFDTFGFDTFGFDTFGFDTFGFDTTAFSDVPSQDVTWTVTGTGATYSPFSDLTTIGNGQALLDAGYAFQLLFYKTYTIPDFYLTSTGCTVRGTPIDLPISNLRVFHPQTAGQLTNFGFDTFGFDTFGFDTQSPADQQSNTTYPVGNGDQVNVTLRAYSPTTSNTSVASASAAGTSSLPVFDPLSTTNGASQAAVSQVANTDGTYNGAFSDSTVPVIVPSISPLPNTAGWNNSNVTVSWSVTDKGSPITSAGLTSSDPTIPIPAVPLTCPTVTIAKETTIAGITLTCTATNGGGKSNSVAVTIKIDKTPPTLVFGAANPAPNANGWNNTNVSFSYTAADALSGVATSLPANPLVIMVEGAGVTGTVTVTDNAGNSAVFTSPAVNIDKTPPAVTASISPAAAATGWYNSATGKPTVSFNCSDALSGLAGNCPAPILVGEGANQSFTGSVTDKAGNTGSATIRGINVDLTPPAITISTPAAGATYVLNQAVASNYACTDTLSGVAACSGPVANGARIDTGSVGTKSFTVAATDIAGNTASVTNNYSVRYNFLLTPPKSPANLGSAVPLIWQLTDAGGAIISDMTSLVSLKSEFTPGVKPVNGVCPIRNPGTVEMLLYNPATGATGNSNFRFVSSSFQFNWDTSTAVPTGPGCYTIVWQLKDNTTPVTSVQLN